MNFLPNTLGKFVWHYLKPHKWCMAGFVVVASIWAVEMSLAPYLLKLMINGVSQFPNEKNKAISMILMPAIAYIVLTLIINLNFRLYDYINLTLYPQIKAAVTKDMFSYMLGHSYGYFQNTFAGSSTKKIWDMAVNIESLIMIPNEWFYPRVFALFIASATLFEAVHPIFGIILFFWGIGSVFLSYIFSGKSRQLAQKNSEDASVLSGMVNDCFTNVMSVKLFHALFGEKRNLEKDVTQLIKSDRALQWYNFRLYLIQNLANTILLAAMIIALIVGFKRGFVSPGDFAMVLSLSISFMRSVYNIGTQMQNFSKAAGICNQALSVIQMKHGVIDSDNASDLKVTKGKIQFQDVQFQYDNNKTLFTDLNVAIPSGQKVGLVGFSGGGKSSFIKLILRLMDIKSGAILIDDQDIKTVTQGSLRSQISTIPQDPDLFHRTIMENIRFAKPDATDEEVIQAAKHAQCHEFIEALPEQYQSLVGERGVKLSGGQKQRIAIARAFLKNAPILLLDEATSSLDSVTEKYIHEALHAVMQNKTTIVIAHRLSTLKDMDRILVFDSGKIVEDGSLDELLKNRSGHFYKLWEMQARGFIPS